MPAARVLLFMLAAVAVSIIVAGPLARAQDYPNAQAECTQLAREWDVSPEHLAEFMADCVQSRQPLYEDNDNAPPPMYGAGGIDDPGSQDQGVPGQQSELPYVETPEGTGDDTQQGNAEWQEQGQPEGQGLDQELGQEQGQAPEGQDQPTDDQEPPPPPSDQ